MMTLNQFQHQLENRGIGKQEAYLFGMMYEQMIELNNQLGMCADLLQAIVPVVDKFTNLHASTQQKVMELQRRGMADGVDVHSVLTDPEEGEKH